MTGQEHLEQTKARALEWLEDMDDLHGTLSIIIDDLKDHPETENHPAITIGPQLAMTGQLNTAQKMRRFIEAII